MGETVHARAGSRQWGQDSMGWEMAQGGRQHGAGDSVGQEMVWEMARTRWRGGRWCRRWHGVGGSTGDGTGKGHLEMVQARQRRAGDSVGDGAGNGAGDGMDETVGQEMA